MEKLLELLQILGGYVDDSAPPIVMLSLYFLGSSCFILLNVINICIYLLSIYIVGLCDFDDVKTLSKKI